MTSDPNDPNFDYKEYCLQQLDNWVNDALNCEKISAQEIYDTIINCSQENATYHKQNFEKNAEVLSLLKGYRETSFEATDEDWNDFWNSESEGKEYTTEEQISFCDKSKYYYEYDRNASNKHNPFQVTTNKVI